MKRILLDTSAYSAFMRGMESAVRAIRDTDEIYLTPIVIGELKAGFSIGDRKGKNEAELADFLSSPRARIADLDADTAEFYALIVKTLRGAGTPIPTNDLWIAASAMQHGLPVLTRDRHFLKVPQILTLELV